jgi:hypothetical protein
MLIDTTESWSLSRRLLQRLQSAKDDDREQKIVIIQAFDCNIERPTEIWHPASSTFRMVR